MITLSSPVLFCFFFFLSFLWSRLTHILITCTSTCSFSLMYIVHLFYRILCCCCLVYSHSCIFSRKASTAPESNGCREPTWFYTRSPQRYQVSNNVEKLMLGRTVPIQSNLDATVSNPMVFQNVGWSFIWSSVHKIFVFFIRYARLDVSSNTPGLRFMFWCCRQPVVLAMCVSTAVPWAVFGNWMGLVSENLHDIGISQVAYYILNIVMYRSLYRDRIKWSYWKT